MTPDQLTVFVLVSVSFGHVVYATLDNAVAAVRWVRRER